MGWAGIGAWTRGWVGSLGKVLGNFDGRGVLEKSACEVACKVAGWPGLGLMLGNRLGLMRGKSAWKFCFVCFNTKQVVMSH